MTQRDAELQESKMQCTVRGSISNGRPCRRASLTKTQGEFGSSAGNLMNGMKRADAVALGELKRNAQTSLEKRKRSL